MEEEKNRLREIKIILIGASKATISVALESTGRLDSFNEKQVAQYLGVWVKQHTFSQDKIYVWGFAPQIYITSERYSSSAQFHNLLITNLSRAFQASQSELAERLRLDFAQNKPKYIFLISQADLFVYLPTLHENYVERVLITPYGNYPYLEKIKE